MSRSITRTFNTFDLYKEDIASPCTKDCAQVVGLSELAFMNAYKKATGATAADKFISINFNGADVIDSITGFILFQFKDVRSKLTEEHFLNDYLSGGV